MSDCACCFISLRRITAVDANDLYDFMVIDSKERDTSKSSFIGLLHCINLTFCFCQLYAVF